MAISVCIKQPEPPKEITLKLPLMGTIKHLNDSLAIIDTASERIAKFQTQLASLMAPVQQFIEIVQAINAIRMCIQAIPDAVITLSPKPILDCMKNLGKAIAVLISLIPPLAYIPTAVDLVDVVIQLLDAIIDLFENLDNKLGNLKKAADKATDLGDTDLSNAVACAQDEIGVVMMNAIDSVAIAQPVLVALLDQLSKLLPGTPLQVKLTEAKVQFQDLETARKDLIGSVSIPLIDPIIKPLVGVRNALAAVYNAVAPLIGKETKNLIIEPTFNNFS